MQTKGKSKRDEILIIKLKGSLRGASPLSRKIFPLPLGKGKGIKGIGLYKLRTSSNVGRN
jgi:hypothetical protein